MNQALVVVLAVVFASCSGSPPDAPAAQPQAPADQAATGGGALSVVLVADPKATAQLLKGWHGVEQGSWRWTEKQFSVALKPPAAGKAATLQLKFSLPEVLLKRLHSITLSASANGVTLPAETYTQPGPQVYAQSVPPNALTGETVHVDFSLDKALGPDENDRRELGLVVSSVGLE